jgi:hypothetical protein
MKDFLIDVMSFSRQKAVIDDTWGHLKPTLNTPYYGSIEIAISEDGQCIILGYLLRNEFGEELNGGPWQQSHLDQWLGSVWDRPKMMKATAGIYKWTGKYTFLKKDEGRFSKGTFMRVYAYSGSANRKKV